MQENQAAGWSERSAMIVAHGVRAVAIVAAVGAALWAAGPYGAWAGLAAFLGICAAGEWIAEQIELEGLEFIGWTLGLTALAAVTVLALLGLPRMISVLTPGAAIMFVVVLVLLNRGRA